MQEATQENLLRQIETLQQSLKLVSAELQDAKLLNEQLESKNRHLRRLNAALASSAMNLVEALPD